LRVVEQRHGQPESQLQWLRYDGRTFGDLPLQGLSKHAYNFSLLYDRGPGIGRLGWKLARGVPHGSQRQRNQRRQRAQHEPRTGPNYGQRNISFGLPTYADDYGQLDGSVFFKINDNFTFGLEVRT
jgi:hypothetical protein